MYAHPTVRGLAAELGSADPAGDRTAVALAVAPPRAAGRRVAARACGVLQLLLLAALGVGGVVLADVDVSLVEPARAVDELFVRVLEALLATAAVTCLLPIAAKWVLIGRWRPVPLQLWSLDYVRFWTVATLVRACPLAYAASPLYALYLRALGARIGPGAVILSRTVPVCTDLLEIGGHAVVRDGVAFSGSQVRAGAVRPGRVRIGAGAVIGEGSLIEPDTVVGDGARLAHASSLHAGQVIPAGRHWHDSPARPADHPAPPLPAAYSPRWRRVRHGLIEPLLLMLGTSVLVTAVVAAGQRWPGLGDAVLPGLAGLSDPSFYLRAIVMSVAVFLGGVALALVVACTVPRVLHRVLVPGRVHPLYGLAHACQRAVDRLTNVPFLVLLLGDSSYVVGYLRAIGYGIAEAGQTGSNVGAALRHGNPYPLTVGPGTMLSDGVDLANVEFSSTAFRVAPLAIGSRCFLGNALPVPAGARLGDDVFIGSKTMIPLDGRPRAGVGLLRLTGLRYPPAARRRGGVRPESDRAAPSARAEERAQPAHDPPVPAGRVRPVLDRVARGPGRGEPRRQRRRVRPGLRGAPRRSARPRLPGPAGTPQHPVPSTCVPATARSTTRTSGTTSGSGSSAPSPVCSTARRSRASCGACSASASGGGSSTTGRA